MQRPRRVHLLVGAITVLVLAVVVHEPVLGRGDFGLEAWPAYALLMGGDVEGFWRASPGYTTFVVGVGAPSALIADTFGWGPEAVFRLTAIPGIAVLTALAVHLATTAYSMSRRGAWAVLFLATGGPVTWLALDFGHPEDLLAAGAAVGAVLASLRGRSVVTVMLLVVAVAAKQWAVLAILLAAACAPRGGVRIALGAGVGAMIIVMAQYVSHPVSASSMTSTSTLFHTRQIWYPFGVEVPFGTAGVGPNERMAPPWLQGLTRPLTVLLAVAIAGGWWLRRIAGRVQAHDVLLILALVFLVRCLFDPWNIAYYHLPMLLSIVAWEVNARRRAPWLSAAVALAVFVGALRWRTLGGPVAYGTYIGWTLPLAAFLLTRGMGLRVKAPIAWRLRFRRRTSAGATGELTTETP